MNIVKLNNGVAVTTTSAISAGTDNEHASVILLVRKYLDDFEEFGGVRFEIEPFETAGGEQSREVGVLNEEQATLLLTYMRNSDIVRAFKKRLVKEFWEAKRKQPKFDPSTLTRIDILKLAMESEEARIKAEAEVLALTHVIEEQKPAVEFVDRFVEAKSAKGFREVAKILGIKERTFITDLANDKIIFKQGSNWLPMADHQHAGRFVVKTGEANGHAFHQCRFTPEGIAWVAKRYAKAA